MSQDLPVLNNANGPNASSRRKIGFAIVVGVVACFAVAAFLLARRGPWASASRTLPASFRLDLRDQLTVDSSLIGYRLVKQLDLPFADARAFAVGADGRTYVAGAKAIHLLDEEGRVQQSIAISSDPSCLAVGGEEHSKPGQLYVATASGLEVYDAQGERVATWPPPNGKTVVSSIAVSAEHLFLADAGNRVVWKYQVDGKRIGRFDLSSESSAGQGGFAVPSKQFDVVVAAEDLLYVTNPGKLQVVAMTFAGDYGGAWGRASTSLDGFFGCCNPTHLAMLPDGRLVTCEKGVPRVKVYQPSGELDVVVAASEQLGVRAESVGDPRLSDQQANFEIAVDSEGRVLVLDPASRCIRIFVAKDQADAGEPS